MWAYHCNIWYVSWFQSILWDPYEVARSFLSAPIRFLASFGAPFVPVLWRWCNACWIRFPLDIPIVFGFVLRQLMRMIHRNLGLRESQIPPLGTLFHHLCIVVWIQLRLGEAFFDHRRWKSSDENNKCTLEEVWTTFNNAWRSTMNVCAVSLPDLPCKPVVCLPPNRCI